MLTCFHAVQSNNWCHSFCSQYNQTFIQTNMDHRCVQIYILTIMWSGYVQATEIDENFQHIITSSHCIKIQPKYLGCKHCHVMMGISSWARVCAVVAGKQSHSITWTQISLKRTILNDKKKKKKRFTSGVLCIFILDKVLHKILEILVLAFTPTSHQGAIKIRWPYFLGALLSSIFMYLGLEGYIWTTRASLLINWLRAHIPLIWTWYGTCCKKNFPPRTLCFHPCLLIG